MTTEEAPIQPPILYERVGDKGYLVYKTHPALFSAFFVDFFVERVRQAPLQWGLPQITTPRELEDISDVTHPLHDPMYPLGFCHRHDDEVYGQIDFEGRNFLEFFARQDPTYLRRRMQATKALESRVKNVVFAGESAVARNELAKIDPALLLQAIGAYSSAMLDEYVRHSINQHHLLEILPELDQQQRDALYNDFLMPRRGRSYQNDVHHALVGLALADACGQADLEHFAQTQGLQATEDIYPVLETERQIRDALTRMRAHKSLDELDYEFARAPLQWQAQRFARQAASRVIFAAIDGHPEADFVHDYFAVTSAGLDYDDMHARMRNRAMRVFRHLFEVHGLDLHTSRYKDLEEVHYAYRRAA